VESQQAVRPAEKRAIFLPTGIAGLIAVFGLTHVPYPWSQYWFALPVVVFSAMALYGAYQFVEHWKWRAVGPGLTAIAGAGVFFQWHPVLTSIVLVFAFCVVAYFVSPDRTATLRPVDRDGVKDALEKTGKELQVALERVNSTELALAAAEQRAQAEREEKWQALGQRDGAVTALEDNQAKLKAIKAVPAAPKMLRQVAMELSQAYSVFAETNRGAATGDLLTAQFWKAHPYAELRDIKHKLRVALKSKGVAVIPAVERLPSSTEAIKFIADTLMQEAIQVDSDVPF